MIDQTTAPPDDSAALDAVRQALVSIYGKSAHTMKREAIVAIVASLVSENERLRAEANEGVPCVGDGDTLDDLRLAIAQAIYGPKAYTMSSVGIVEAVKGITEENEQWRVEVERTNDSVNALSAKRDELVVVSGYLDTVLEAVREATGCDEGDELDGIATMVAKIAGARVTADALAHVAAAVRAATGSGERQEAEAVVDLGRENAGLRDDAESLASLRDAICEDTGCESGDERGAVAIMTDELRRLRATPGTLARHIQDAAGCPPGEETEAVKLLTAERDEAWRMLAIAAETVLGATSGDIARDTAALLTALGRIAKCIYGEAASTRERVISVVDSVQGLAGRAATLAKERDAARAELTRARANLGGAAADVEHFQHLAEKANARTERLKEERKLYRKLLTYSW